MVATAPSAVSLPMASRNGFGPAPIKTSSRSWLPPTDDQGGAIYFANQDTPNQFGSYCYIGHIDENGTETWQYQETNCSEDYAIAPDGTIFLVEDAYQNTNTAVITALDPNTGQVKFNITLPPSSQATSGGGSTEGLDPNRPSGLVYCTPGTPGVTVTQTMATHGNISASSDGSVYIPFTTSTQYGDASGCDPTPDPSYPNFPHLVQPTDGTWSASATLQWMIIHTDGTQSTQQLDANSANGTGTTIGSTAGFFGMGRSISDGQGGALLTLSSPPALYHASSARTSKFTLPIIPDAPPGSDLYTADSVLLGEDGTAYIAGSSTPQAPVDTVLAVDSSSGTVKWTTSPGVHPKLSTVAADGSLAFQYELPDFSVHSALADPNGNVSPLFANPDNSDAGPVLSNSFGSHVPGYWSLSIWHMSENDGGLAARTGNNSGLSGSEYTREQGNRQKQHAAQNLVTATFMPRLPGNAGADPWGDEAKAKTELLNQISQVARSRLFYSVTQPPLATADAFLAENGTQPMHVLGFIGDSDVLNCSTPDNPSCHFSDGLLFTDRYLIRTPNCDSPNLGLCYYPDTTGSPHAPPCGVGEMLVGANCYYVVPPCNPDAVQIGNVCFRFPIGRQSGLPARLESVLLTSAKVVFVASCQTTDVFSNWWDLNLNAVPGGRALVVPDIATMATLNANNGTPPQNQGFVDLVQGAVAYEAFVKVFGGGKSAQDAVNAANQAVASLYPTLVYPSPPGQLPQLVYKIVGNPNVCVNCKRTQ